MVGAAAAVGEDAESSIVGLLRSRRRAVPPPRSAVILSPRSISCGAGVFAGRSAGSQPAGEAPALAPDKLYLLADKLYLPTGKLFLLANKKYSSAGKEYLRSDVAPAIPQAPASVEPATRTGTTFGGRSKYICSDRLRGREPCPRSEPGQKPQWRSLLASGPLTRPSATLSPLTRGEGYRGVPSRERLAINLCFLREGNRIVPSPRA